MVLKMDSTPPQGVEIEVVNVIVSTRLDQSIDIEKMAVTLKRAEYEPEVFPGLIYRRSDPKATIIMFSSGKITSIGTKSERDGKLAIDKTVSELSNYFPRKPTYGPITTANLVAVGRFPSGIDMHKVLMTIVPIDYQPRKYPGAIHKVSPHSSILIYSTGRVIYSGARSEAEAKNGIMNLLRELGKKGCFVQQVRKLN